MIKYCEHCKAEFQTSKHYTKQRFCSHSCRGKWSYANGINKPPLRTNKEPWNKGLTKEDDKRIRKYSDDRKGNKNWMWNNGATTRFRDKIKRKLCSWREKVFERDNYNCQNCGIRGRELHPHHIIPISINKKLALNVENGITLCVKCHKEVHRK